MNRLNVSLSLCVLVVALAMPATTPLRAQHHPGAPVGHAASLYVGMDSRPIKALSEQQIADLRAGRGMGLALAAELNGYPGPMHVLEHAEALALSDEQWVRTRVLIEAMTIEASALGARIIAEEQAFDRLFAEKRATSTAVDDAAARIAALQGELRTAHLRYHLAMIELLSPEQTARYMKLRGYSGR